MPFTDGTGQTPINIICQSSEDGADDTIVPRFISAATEVLRQFRPLIEIAREEANFFFLLV